MNPPNPHDYAHMEIVVVLIVVKKLGFLVITRDHGSFGGRHQVEILPTGLPELFKAARDLLEPTKTTRTTRTTTTKTTKTLFFPKFSRISYLNGGPFFGPTRVPPFLRYLLILRPWLACTP